MPIPMPARETMRHVRGPARPALTAAASAELREIIARAQARAGL